MRTYLRGAAIFLLAFFPALLVAQSAGYSGTLSGVITDPTGAVVPGASVSIHNPVSQYERTVTTDKAGHFQFPNVPFNPYHLSVTMAGFSNTSRDVDVVSVVPVSANVSLKV